MRLVVERARALVCPKCTGEYGELFSADAKRYCPQCLKQWTGKELKYIGLIFHDLQRAAVRTMVHSDVLEVTMIIWGHKTQSVFDRITS
jgi:hypothetical protein